MVKHSIPDAGERVVRRFTVEERTDAFGTPEFCVVAHGEFEEPNHEWRIVKRSRRVVFVTPDAKDAYLEAGWLNESSEAGASA